MKKVLIFYSHFAPSFKGGGPVQSLTNLVDYLQDDCLFYVLCGAYEVGETSPLPGIKTDEWTNYNSGTRIFYATRISYQRVVNAINEVAPDVVYINGLYLLYYNWLPLFVAQREHRKVVMASRGMLQKEALKVKPLKKRIFLALLRASGLTKSIRWHATERQEEADIRSHFGREADIQVIPNVPKPMSKEWKERAKQVGELRLVFLSLIAEMKNLHLVLEALRQVNTPLVFDIYGPVKDSNYWLQCQPLMANSKHHINYKGPVKPANVQEVLQQYHAFILPTRGENFGHAIYEAMSVGTLPIISTFTPWGRLQELGIGITVETWERTDWVNAIEQVMASGQAAFNSWSLGTYMFAKSYFEKNDFKSGYRILFE